MIDGVSSAASQCALCRPSYETVGRAVLLTCAMLFGATSARAQSNAAFLPADVATPEAVVDALYDVLSGEPGERNWARYLSLVHPDGVLLQTVTDSTGKFFRRMSHAGFMQWVNPYYRENPWYEREIASTVLRFGDIAQIWSTYEAKRSPTDTETIARGINSFHLIHDGRRWWLLNAIWDEERVDNPLPARFLPQP